MSRSKKRAADKCSFDDLEVTLDMSEAMTDCKRVKLAPSLMLENKMNEVKDEVTKKTYSCSMCPSAWLASWLRQWQSLPSNNIKPVIGGLTTLFKCSFSSNEMLE